MADISKIKIPNGTTYNIKDEVARTIMTGATPSADGAQGLVPAPTSGNQNDYLRGDGLWCTITEGQLKPVETHTYTDIIATKNESRYATFFFAKVNMETWDGIWRVKLKITVTVPGQLAYNATTITELWGTAVTCISYKNQNSIKSTSYRPVYYVSIFTPSSTGFQNGCGAWIGINLVSSGNNTNASYKRSCVVELLDYENCTVEFVNSVITPDNIPNLSAHANWYTSIVTSFNNFDFSNPGLRETGDENLSVISRLHNYYTYYTTDSVLYRYQMLFSMSEDRVTPLNNVNNSTGTTKKMLTNVEFDPFGRIFFYNTTTTIAANSLINNSGPVYMYDLIDLRYTFNITSGVASETVMTLVSNKNVYLKVYPTTNGKVKLASATPLVQELPSTEDGYWYILLGRQFDWYRMTLLAEHPVYEYYNGAIRERKPSMHASEYIGDGSQITNINGSNISSGTVSETRIASLSATKITSGTFDAARIPNLDAGKITSGTLSADRIPFINASKITDGTLSVDRLPASGATAGSYGPSGNQSPAHGGTFSVPSITADAKGRVTSASTKTVTLPTYSTATSSANGLMSATDKSKLDSMTTVPIASGLNMTEGTDGLIFTYVS